MQITSRIPLVLALLLAAAALLLLRAQGPVSGDEELWQHRNLGKAFFENPTTQYQAVDEFKKALDLAPDSARERLNYGLALLRAGKMAEGVAELEKVQRQEPSLPHTWFNLGVIFKKEAQYERSIQQFQKMVELVPDEPVSHYNLGVLYKLTGRQEQVLKEFQTASQLDPNLAGPHFQLANTYRALGRAEDADRELKVFQEIKKRQAGAAVPEDLEWSTFAEILDLVEPVAGAAETAPRPELRFRDTETAAGLSVENAGLALLDTLGDATTDLLAWSSGRVGLYRRGVRQVENSGLSELANAVSAAPGDFNNDGLADLCVITDSDAILYVNAKGTFQKQPAALAAGRYRRAIWIDYDHDGDVDLILLGDASQLWRNNGAAGFSNESASFPFVAGRAADGVILDLVKDTHVSDLAVIYQDRAAVLYRDRLAGRYEALPLQAPATGSRWIVASDIDNDGWTDLALASDAGLQFLRNAQGKLQPVPGPASAKGSILFADLQNRGAGDLIAGAQAHDNQGLFRFSEGRALADLEGTAASVAADFDGDGRVDLAVVSDKGSLRLLTNETAGAGHWIGVSLLGVRNLKLAPGAQVEIKAGALYQKKIYRGVPLLFGLQARRETETVRITWPNLLIQNEIRQPADKSVAYQEKQRLSGSCPMIFAWNGKKFEFITDILGIAPLGVSGGDGQYLPVDHQEYIQIPGTSLAAVDNRYQIRITEELHEVAYLDQVKLLAVDHPAGMDMFTNEKFQAPPFPGLRLYGVKRRIDARSARDHRDRDVLSQILRRDRTYPDFERDPSGVAESHFIDLDFGPQAAPGNRAILVLHGWFDWADGSTFLRVSQERKGGLRMPYLQVRDPQGRWQTVVEDMGIPTGKPKTIVVELTGKFLSASRQIRIGTDLCVYWDEIFLSEETGPPSSVVLSPLETAAVELRFGGFSALDVHPERKQPEWFDYTRRTSTSNWNPTPGLYTRYGDVRELLDSAEDRFVIMGSGDELRFLFDPQKLPRLKPGFKRDFLLQVDGWAKDADWNTALSQTVEPLPFHGMSRYPYPEEEKFPDDPGHREYRARYNTRPALRLLRPLDEGIRNCGLRIADCGWKQF
ncbi:MAG: VCBS repeat-containing protein [Acidobacteria bacterium]|nr:VCBS repeat-containing protein [Acidobacteriota bacterium]